MRVLIIRPRDRNRYPRLFAKLFRIHEIGLLMIAKTIRDISEVTYVDENHLSIPMLTDYDVVLITVQTHLAPRSYELALQCRKNNVTVILGGPHVTLNPKESLQYANAIALHYLLLK